MKEKKEKKDKPVKIDKVEKAEQVQKGNKKLSKELLLKTKYYIIGAGILISIIILIGAITYFNMDKTPDKPEEPVNETPKGEQVTKDSIEKDFGVSEQEAIDIVKKVYNSDVYEFTVKALSDNTYEVTSKNVATNTVTVFIVDPATKLYSIK